MAVKVLLVDDHLIVINGLKYYFQTQSHVEIVGHALNGEEALRLVDAYRPDIVLMDLRMPDMDGIEATRRITQQYPEVKVVVLTGFADRDAIIPAIRAGAIGYQLKNVDPDVLLDTIMAAMSGTRMIHPTVMNQWLSWTSEEAEASARLDELTAKEKEVLYHITLGKSNKEIAADLYITEKTVKTHITKIFMKMDVHDRTQAALYALRNRWFE